MKYRKSTVLAALMALLLCCGSGAGEQESSEVEPGIDVEATKAIEVAREQLLDAYLARDLDRWLAGFTEDVVVMPPDARMIVGLDALREASRLQFGGIEDYEVEIDSDLLEIVVAGDWAYTRDGYEFRYRPPDGDEPILDRGRSLTIWRLEPDGAWRVSRHMMNRPTHGPG